MMVIQRNFRHTGTLDRIDESSQSSYTNGTSKTDGLDTAEGTSQSSYTTNGSSKLTFTAFGTALSDIDEVDDSEEFESDMDATERSTPAISVYDTEATESKQEEPEVKALLDDDDESACSADERETPEGVILRRVFCTPWNPRNVFKIFMEDYSILSDELLLQRQKEEEANPKRVVVLTASEINLIKESLKEKVTTDGDPFTIWCLLKTLNSAQPVHISTSEGTLKGSHDGVGRGDAEVADDERTVQSKSDSVTVYSRGRSLAEVLQMELQRSQGVNELMEKRIVELEEMNAFMNSRIVQLQQNLSRLQFKNEVFEENNRMLRVEIESLKQD